jgi:hypothetical protein
MAFDRDGTQGVKIDGANNMSTMTNAELVSLNDEADTTVSQFGSPWKLCLIFPELRDLDGYFRNISGKQLTVETSVDTTNGFDGTWVTLSASTGETAVNTVSTKPNYRTGIASSTVLAIRAIRFGGQYQNFGTSDFRSVHLYGEPVPGENPNRLALWHPTLDQRVTPAYFDWGNVPRSSSADRTFRVKNLSASLTANSVRVAMEALSDTTPSVPAQHTLSADGTTFLAQVNIGALAPGAISAPLTLRRITPSNAVLSLWSFRVFAESTTTWS